MPAVFKNLLTGVKEMYMARPGVHMPLRLVGIGLIALTLLASACSSGASTPLPVGGGAAVSPVAPTARPATSPAPGSGQTPSAFSASTVPACPSSGAAPRLTGAGATFPAPLYTRWFSEYNSLCKIEINYQA